MGQQDAAFVRNFMYILAVMVIFAFVIFGIAQVIGSSDQKPVATAKSEANIKRVAVVATEKNAVVSKKISVASKVVRGGQTAEQLGAACYGCHRAGVAGAPKVGDKAAWAARSKKGMAAMVQIVVKGKGAMPPKGGTTLNDKQIEKVIKSMMK